MKKLLLVASLVGFLTFSADLFAKVRINESDAEDVSVTVKDRDVIVQCYLGEGGRSKFKKGSWFFFSFSKALRKKNRAFKVDPTPKRKKQRSNVRALKRASDDACSGLQRNPDDPQPDPTPAPSQGPPSYFAANGDVTALGKATFEIPTSINANAFVGEAVFQLNCSGCHEKRSRPTLPLLRLAISQPPMFYTEELLSDQDAADLTAYLNLSRIPPN